jgi:hypothetical protein
MDGIDKYLAPHRFVAWLCDNIANDKKYGRKVFRYHPRSDEHSKQLCRLILQDIVRACPLLVQHAREGRVVAGINTPYRFPNGKGKNLDLAVGVPMQGEVKPAPSEAIAMGVISVLRLACEAKQCMTEHSKTQPRIFDELSSSHEIVHQGDRNAISAGIVVVNIADRYASPTRQVSGEGDLIFTKHRQPAVTGSMVSHLRGLVIRDDENGVGFDAFATIVINCDNVGACNLHATPPAPQEGDRDHYLTFLQRISAAYTKRYYG